MYELLTLHRVRSALFEAETDPEGGIEGLPEIVTGKYPEYSEALRTLVRQCLRPNPQDRPRIADMENQIQACRRQIAQHFYELRGDNKSVPSDEERLYYRGNEIETMEPGYWLPSNPRNFGGPESGFADPDLGPIKFPRFPSLDMAVATGEGHQTNQHGDEGRKLNRAQYADTKAQRETVDVEGYGPDGTETDHDGDPMDEVTVEPRTMVKPGRGLMNKFGRPTMI
jgi:serine/threonine protein kinase